MLYLVSRMKIQKTFILFSNHKIILFDTRFYTVLIYYSKMGVLCLNTSFRKR